MEWGNSDGKKAAAIQLMTKDAKLADFIWVDEKNREPIRMSSLNNVNTVDVDSNYWTATGKTKKKHFDITNGGVKCMKICEARQS